MRLKQALQIADRPAQYPQSELRLAWLVLTNKALRAFPSSPHQNELRKAYRKISETLTPSQTD